MEQMQAVVRDYFRADVAGNYSAMYQLLDPRVRAEETLQQFSDSKERFRKWNGVPVAFEIGDVVFTSSFTMVVDSPPKSFREGSSEERFSLVAGQATWMAQDGKWWLLVHPWPWAVSPPLGKPSAPERLPVGRAQSSVWSAKTKPVPECLDAPGLEKALERLMQALMQRDNAGVYNLLSPEARSKMSQPKFEAAMKESQAQWLKPVRVHYVSRPELCVLVTLTLRPAPGGRERLEKYFGRKLGETVRWHANPRLSFQDGKWYIDVAR
jgi:hypothetical protein